MNRKKPNLFLYLLVFIIIFFLYSQNQKINKLTDRLGVIEEKRLKLLEDKFGGEKNLKCNESETVKKVRNSVVRIIGGEAEGSGFIVNDNGYVLTNFHVIEFEPAPKVMFVDNTFETGEILYADKNADLAILKINKKVPTINWSNSDLVNPAQEILSFGYPFGGTMTGEATVLKGNLSAKRIVHDIGMEYLQTDATLNPGMSGGPMTTVCGDFVGINTMGTAGVGLAISSNSFKQKYLEMIASKEPLKDIKRIEFNPNGSPLETVTAFYNYIKIRKLDKAYGLLTDNFLEGATFDQWKKGYTSNMDTSVLKIENDPLRENFVKIKLSTKDLIGDAVVYKYFEGTWEVKEIDGNLKLWSAGIKEVKDPDIMWFYE